jgi:hypothetical protein
MEQTRNVHFSHLTFKCDLDFGVSNRVLYSSYSGDHLCQAISKYFQRFNCNERTRQ